jgi:hypothetical protein
MIVFAIPVGGCQLGEPVLAHRGHDEGVLRQQAVIRLFDRAPGEGIRRKAQDCQVHLEDRAEFRVVARQPHDQVRPLLQEPDGRPGGNEPGLDRLHDHQPVDHLRQCVGGRVA